ncbi:uncharacterized protein with FMN-binding domain [Kineothrix alysoides]|uniref:Uncharacterized protein with FMN-binding domain n=1 Tax=Kineothrix alysoides TaxID=1469948 RepID=A0A4R1QX44_9FIRM|nr:FMN-binding protein [Kineothrix alysoides]TCL57695.1 uncharacterized protein with FMN-binding domain [Kineothrix alysoides]
MTTSKSIIAKTLKIIAIIFTILLCIIIVLLLTQKPKDLEILNVDVSAIKDGIYVGNADNGLVKAAVSVEISNGMILNISILEHDNLLGKPAEKIIDSIVEQQSLDVDAITSATYSSDTIRKAVENALRQGE